MAPNLHKTSCTELPASRAHLLAVEMEMNEAGGWENPEAVMDEVAFRATHISSLMAEMFEYASKKDWWVADEP